MSAHPHEGDVWDALLEPGVGHEQGGRRPVLVVSSEMLNTSPSGLVMVVPLTHRDRGIPGHVGIAPPGGGVTHPLVALCDQVRTISTERLQRHRGTVQRGTLRGVRRALMILLDLPPR